MQWMDGAPPPKGGSGGGETSWRRAEAESGAEGERRTRPHARGKTAPPGKRGSQKRPSSIADRERASNRLFGSSNSYNRSGGLRTATTGAAASVTCTWFSPSPTFPPPSRKDASNHGEVEEEVVEVEEGAEGSRRKSNSSRSCRSCSKSRIFCSRRRRRTATGGRDLLVTSRTKKRRMTTMMATKRRTMMTKKRRT